MARIAVASAEAVSDELFEALAALVPQLSQTATPLTREALEEIIASPATDLLVARNEGGGVLGALTLVLFRIPTGIRAWIEDVVVDERARGWGIGQALVQAALTRAEEAGARTVDLTSRRDRGAGRLYLKAGFERRATDVYRFTLPDSQ